MTNTKTIINNILGKYDAPGWGIYDLENNVFYKKGLKSSKQAWWWIYEKKLPRNRFQPKIYDNRLIS